jgi:iron-sulfur cluster assembly protein
MGIVITDAAAQRIRQTAENEGVQLDNEYLRIAVRSGGCSGLTYDLGWDPVKSEDDTMVETAGLRVLMDTSASLYLDGATLHFTEGLEGKGFHFDNPQAARTCACGESFSV